MCLTDENISFGGVGVVTAIAGPYAADAVFEGPGKCLALLLCKLSWCFALHPLTAGRGLLCFCVFSIIQVATPVE